MNLEIEKIIKKYTNYIYKVITNISKGNLSNEDIEEIISDVFLVFWQNKEKYDSSRNLNLYLSGIARNLVKKKFRKLCINSNIEDYENYILYDNFDYERLDRYKIIEKTLDTCSEEDKKIFVLYYYYSKSIKEISKNLSLSELSIKSRLYRTRRK